MSWRRNFTDSSLLSKWSVFKGFQAKVTSKFPFQTAHFPMAALLCHLGEGVWGGEEGERVIWQCWSPHCDDCQRWIGPTPWQHVRAGLSVWWWHWLWHYNQKDTNTYHTFQGMSCPDCVTQYKTSTTSQVWTKGTTKKLWNRIKTKGAQKERTRTTGKVCV